jgi:hypothetical protein
MTRHASFLVAIPALATALGAQGATVLPYSATYAEANSNNTIPWWSATHRYQQIHNDARGRVMILRGICLRRDGDIGGQSSAIARTVDIEISVGTGDFATATGSFASNYTNTPTKVFNRKNVNLPDFTQNLGKPAPWSIVFNFDAPWPYLGMSDLLWDLSVFSTTSSGWYSMDAHSGYQVTTQNGSSQKIGTGCVATGQTTEMGVSSTMQTSSTASTLSYSWAVSSGRANSPVALLLGITNPDLQIPGLCAKLFVTPAITIGGMTDGTGGFSLPSVTSPHNPSWDGAHLHAQAVCADAGRPGLPYAASHGLDSVVPGLPPNVCRVWTNDVNSPTGSRSETYPYCLVTRYLHQ